MLKRDCTFKTSHLDPQLTDFSPFLYFLLMAFVFKDLTFFSNKSPLHGIVFFGRYFLLLQIDVFQATIFGPPSSVIISVYPSHCSLLACITLYGRFFIYFINFCICFSFVLIFYFLLSNILRSIFSFHLCLFI